MRGYVSRRYLREKWDKLKWDMEKVLDVYGDGPDNIVGEADSVKGEVGTFLSAILKEIGAYDAVDELWGQSTR